MKIGEEFRVRMQHVCVLQSVGGGLVRVCLIIAIGVIEAIVEMFPMERFLRWLARTVVEGAAFMAGLGHDGKSIEAAYSALDFGRLID